MKILSRPYFSLACLLLLGACLFACGGNEAEGEAGRSGGPGGGQTRSGGGFPGPPAAPAAAVPVEVAPVTRRSISSFIETNGTLEAENEVDIVARITAPVTALATEEGMRVGRGQLLARLDDKELASQAEISRVNLQEAEQAWERAQTLLESQLVSPEEFEQAQTRVETARAQYESDRIRLGYTEIRAPFDGLIIARYIDLAEQVNPGTPLFRISDFTPLLCPIQVPERDLPKLQLGQKAYLTFEAWPEKRFSADVLRIRPVVDALSGTVRVTLDVDSEGLLRPGMFARVFVETETRDNTLVIPKVALSLESIGDIVYVADGDTASRRSVGLGFREGDFVEVLEGVSEGEQVIVVGQDGLSEGTPIHVLDGGADQIVDSGPDFSQLSAEQLQEVRERMRARGLSEEEIDQRLGRGTSGDTGRGE